MFVFVQNQLLHPRDRLPLQTTRKPTGRQHAVCVSLHHCSHTDSTASHRSTTGLPQLCPVYTHEMPVCVLVTPQLLRRFWLKSVCQDQLLHHAPPQPPYYLRHTHVCTYILQCLSANNPTHLHAFIPCLHQ